MDITKGIGLPADMRKQLARHARDETVPEAVLGRDLTADEQAFYDLAVRGWARIRAGGLRT